MIYSRRERADCGQTLEGNDTVGSHQLVDQSQSLDADCRFHANLKRLGLSHCFLVVDRSGLAFLTLNILLATTVLPVIVR